MIYGTVMVPRESAESTLGGPNKHQRQTLKQLKLPPANRSSPGHEEVCGLQRKTNRDESNVSTVMNM